MAAVTMPTSLHSSKLCLNTLSNSASTIPDPFVLALMQICKLFKHFKVRCYATCKYIYFWRWGRVRLDLQEPVSSKHTCQILENWVWTCYDVSAIRLCSVFPFILAPSKLFAKLVQKVFLFWHNMQQCWIQNHTQKMDVIPWQLYRKCQKQLQRLGMKNEN